MARLFKTKTLLVILVLLIKMPIFSQNVEMDLYKLGEQKIEWWKPSIEIKEGVTIVNKPVGEFENGIAWFKDNGKYGGINKNLEIIIPPIYSNSFRFKNGVAVVKKENRMGIISIDGVELLPLDYYSDIKYKGYGIYEICKQYKGEYKYGIFYNNSLVLPCDYKGVKVSNFHFPFITMYDNNYKYTRVNVINGECYEDYCSDGKVVVAKRDNEYFYFEEGTGRLLNKELLEQNSLGLKFFYDEQTKKYGIVDSMGQVVKKPSYYSIHKDFPIWWYNNNAIVKNTGSDKASYILLSELGNIMIKTKKKEEIYRYTTTNEYLKIVKSKFKEGLYGLDGIQILPCKYRDINHIQNHFFCVKENYIFKKGLLYDVTNQIFYEGRVAFYNGSDLYSDTNYDTDSNMLKMELDNDNDLTYGYYYVNLTTGNRIRTYPRYCSFFSEGLAVVCDENINGEWFHTVINNDNDIIFRDNDTIRIDNVSEGVITVYDKINKAYGFIYNPLGHEGYEYNNKGGVSTDAVVTWIRIATDLFDQKRYTDSKDYFYYAMLALPTNTYPIIGYSACLANLGHYDEAIEVCHIALDIEPDNETAKNNLEIMIRGKEELEMRRQQEQEARQRELEEQRQRELEARQQQEYYAQQNNSSSGSFWDALSNFCTALDNALGSTYHSYDYSSSYNSSSSGSYQEQYNRWEQRAKSNYESLTNLGYDAKGSDGSRSGSTGQSMSGGNYTLQKKALREAQREMRNIRQRASQAGVYIKQSKYETATVGY